MPRSAWGTSIFADDIRAEVGGKVSLMGIYQIDMLFPFDFPVTIAKFVIFVRYFEEASAGFTDDLVLTVIAAGKSDPIVSINVPRADLDGVPYPYKDSLSDAEQDKLLRLQAPIMFSPLVVPEEGFIQVRMQCGPTTTRLGRLMLRKARPEDNVDFSSLPSNASALRA